MCLTVILNESNHIVCVRYTLRLIILLILASTLLSKRRIPNCDSLDSEFSAERIICNERNVSAITNSFNSVHEGQYNVRREMLSSSIEDHRITNLPGLDTSIRLDQYAGHILVDSKTRGNFFYWLFESSKDPGNDPIIIWLNGVRKTII